jgi:hypothetical protein
MFKLYLKIFISLSILIFFFACTDHENAIYYYIEHESELAKDAFSDGRSVNGMVKTSAGRIYIAAAPSMWTRAAGGSAWSKVRMAPKAQVSLGLVDFTVSGEERIYCGFDNGLYYITDISGNTKPTWMATGITRQIIRMKEVNGILFVSTSTGSLNTLYYCRNTSGTFTEVTNLTNINHTIEDITYDSTSGNYLAVAGNKVYIGSDESNMNMLGITQPVTSGNFMGIICTAGGNYYAATDNGYIFYSGDGGGSWGNHKFSVSNKDVPFRRFAQIPVATGKVFVGSLGFGYYVTDDTNEPAFSRAGDFTVQQLYAGVVDDFFIAMDNTTVYALTHGTGIWHHGYDNVTGDLTKDTDNKEIPWEQL